MTNIIRKQCVEISCDGKTDPFEFRDEVSWFCTGKLIPAIEKLFDEYATANVTISFGEVNIDLGEIPFENWQEVFVSRLIEELRHYLTSTSLPASQRLIGHPAQANMSRDTSKEIFTLEHSVRSSLFYFLEHGTLPWNSRIKTRSDIENALKELINSTDECNRLISRLRGKEAQIKRLINQFTNGSLDLVIRTCTSLNETVLDDLKKLINKIVDREGLSIVEKRVAMYAILLSVITDGGVNTTTPSAYIEAVLTDISDTPIFAQWMNSLTTDTKAPIASAEEKIKQLFASDQSHPEGQGVSQEILETLVMTLAKKHRPHAQTDEGSSLNETSGKSAQQGKDTRKEKKTGRKDIAGTNSEQEWFISNAGLVLLHPFLPMLFDNTGYTGKKEWISAETQHRAIMLTQFLVMGEKECPEFDLVLNKILTGYALEDTLPADIVLSDFEKGEASDVLQSVIRHWSALKNTTTAGLQSEFLQRNGKLSFESGQWSLKVEQKTSDILVNRLPWGISMIKTPWMKTMMQVEWT